METMTDTVQKQVPSGSSCLTCPFFQPTGSHIVVFSFFHSTLCAERFNIRRACSDCPLILLIILFALSYYLQDLQNEVTV